MEVSEEFRKNAQQCFTLAHEKRTPEGYIHWLDMACLWFDLARHAEEREMNSGRALSHDTAQGPVRLAG